MRRLVWFGVAWLVATGATAALKVKARAFPGPAVSSYETYGWKSNQDNPDALLGEGASMASGMEALGDEILAARGFSPADEPDLWIRYTALSHGDLQVADPNVEEPDDVRWVADPSGHFTVSYRKGTLLLEFVDAETEKLVWAGWASDVVPADERVIRKKVDRAIVKILKQLPRR